MDAIKTILVGEEGVGKTCLMARFCPDMHVENPIRTKGFAHATKEVTVLQQSVRIHIFDTAGTERYRSLAKSHFYNADAVVIVYDITQQKTFDELQFWLEEIRNYAPEQALLAVVGNKEDLIAREVVSVAKAEKLARKINASFTKTSAVTNLGVHALFTDIAKRYLETSALHKPTSIKLKPRRSPTKQKRCC